VSAERLFELARHLTERDREVALYLYRHRVLTTDQLQLLFFSSRRRAQDRLLFLYRNRLLDRFYPQRRSATASRRRTGCSTRRARSWSRRCTTSSANSSAGSGVTTGARIPSWPTSWR
jgi:hypothetical protein